eukprot:CAMPEP_0182439052 /NCGR_PEP_ID=MMETSP1167-20130531/86187_1 /TAXON_ID=2988 /ORGANISM="Mallomonas Sp, Strain CCMP3275" /LENGTH=237 /DNA_ID=CAMNT_0024632639 /DNA_START=389 /DNA_END=1099 /DNA_ORIENTATION=+
MNTPGGTGGMSEESLYESVPAVQSAICTYCGFSSCLSCENGAHSPCSCEQWQDWIKRVKEEMATTEDLKEGDDVANQMWVAANTKKCPRCQTHIEKNEGCNHMSCRKCRHEFCWICMQDWSLHSNNTGGFFQCNRFESTTGKNNEDEGENSAISALMDVEGGSAMAEQMRMKIKADRMARFLHHFTRCRAHGESIEMEYKMKRDTIYRLQESLLRTKHGELIWLQGTAVTHPLGELS